LSYVASCETGNTVHARARARAHTHTRTHIHIRMYINFTRAVDRDSSVGIATRYGLDGPGVESRLRRDFPSLSRPALGPTQPSVQWVPGLSQGVKRPGRGVDHPLPSGAEVKERVELYIHYCVWAFKASFRLNFTFKARSKNCEKPLLVSSCLSVRQHRTTRLPLDGFS
jgi:hypothetical protein